eukprot:scaffold107648_cov35-Phaeocystis_antarctica.AAC.1
MGPELFSDVDFGLNMDSRVALGTPHTSLGVGLGWASNPRRAGRVQPRQALPSRHGPRQVLPSRQGAPRAGLALLLTHACAPCPGQSAPTARDLEPVSGEVRQSP